MAVGKLITVDGNEAAASVAHRLSDVIVIYPITPSSPMGELADEWAAKGKKNIFGQLPDVVEMQSEAGAIAAVHGALQAGTMSTTFTASQGLLLMIPSLFKIAGELTPFTMHVAARAVATSALSIFGDHSDVMACRQTGVAMIASQSVQESHDLAAIAHAATLETRVPFMHFFDGFRTSHELNQLAPLTDDNLRALVNGGAIAAFRARGLTPDKPVLRGTAQNPDTYFQSREAVNRFYQVTPAIVQKIMDRFAAITGRQYHLFSYHGHPQAERIVVLMGSGVETVDATVDRLVKDGEKIGCLNVRLYRPLDLAALIAALPKSLQKIAVLDRTKEPGALGEPLYLDMVAAFDQANRTGLWSGRPTIVGGRYGISSKEFTPAMAKAVFDELKKPQPLHGFTVGIMDDVTHLSLKVDQDFHLDQGDVVNAMFFGLGADGTVGANKNSIKIISEETPKYAQGYFVYDSKKSGAVTTSHLRFGSSPIKAPYLLQRADFVACHQFPFLEKIDVLDAARPGATFLLNAPYPADEVWNHLSNKVKADIVGKKLKFYTIDAVAVAEKAGMGRRINTVMQTCFFAISGILPREQAIEKIKLAAQKTYGKKGQELVERNWKAIDQSLENLHEVKYPTTPVTDVAPLHIVSDQAPDFVQRVTAMMLAGKGDLLPVSAFPIDGTYPTATTQWEKRSIATEIPIWVPELCIQCNKCSLVCPHACIRVKAYDPAALNTLNAGNGNGLPSANYKAPDMKGLKYTVQVAPDDCTGCTLCVNVCPAKDKSDPKRKAINMESFLDHVAAERKHFDAFMKIPDLPREKITRIDAKGSQFFRPLFEFSGACAGCGETPYVKLLTQLFGDRLLIGNATGCSSIYGGNLPTTPYCQDANGRGPAWNNSLFEDAAEFALGLRLGVDRLSDRARLLLTQQAPSLDENLVKPLLIIEPLDEVKLLGRRAAIAQLRKKLAGTDDPAARELSALADYLVPKSVWGLGGDGWAYDIGYGGLDHVLSMNRKINILVLDTEVYSNTGGQQSKSTPTGAAAKFAAKGKEGRKKDLGLMAMSYEHVYVASVAFGENDTHTVKAFLEAESNPGPSIIIAYSHCIAHGYDLSIGLEQQQRAVRSGVWPLYRYDPRRLELGEPPLQVDSRPPKIAVADYMRNEARFRMVEQIDPARFQWLGQKATEQTRQRLSLYEQLSKVTLPKLDAQAVAEAQAKADEE